MASERALAAERVIGAFLVEHAAARAPEERLRACDAFLAKEPEHPRVAEVRKRRGEALAELDAAFKASLPLLEWTRKDDLVPEPRLDAAVDTLAAAAQNPAAAASCVPARLAELRKRQGARLPLPDRLRRGQAVLSPSTGWLQLFIYTLPQGAGELELVHVPAGDFLLGDDSEALDPDSKPAHRHPMPRAFWIGHTELTWPPYLAFCAATRRATPARPAWATDAHPVVNVTWDDAQAFCAWAGLALPTEIEWEKAARGPDGWHFPWGNQDPTPARCVYQRASDSPAGCDRVGAHPMGVSPYGALDMSGNVWEWCADFYDAEIYRRYAEGKLEPAKEGDHVKRGGGWQSRPGCMMSAWRANQGLPDAKDTDQGFRVCLRAAGRNSK